LRRRELNRHAARVTDRDERARPWTSPRIDAHIARRDIA
jgi:hypothetical protein